MSDQTLEPTEENIAYLRKVAREAHEVAAEADRMLDEALRAAAPYHVGDEVYVNRGWSHTDKKWTKAKIVRVRPFSGKSYRYWVLWIKKNGEYGIQEHEHWGEIRKEIPE
jgi:hypothetical protein